MRSTIIVATCVLVGACSAVPAKPVDTAATKAALDDASARLSRGFASGSYDSVAAVLTEDHVGMPPNASPIVGRDQWLAWAKSALADAQVSSVGTPEVRLYGDSVTIERGRYVNTIAPKTSPAMADTGKYVWVWKRTASGWQIAQAIWNSNSAPKP